MNFTNPLLPVSVVDDISRKSLPPTHSFFSVEADNLTHSDEIPDDLVQLRHGGGGAVTRFVCGYLFTGADDNDRSRVDATHTWVEVWLPALGWIGFDPTNNLIAGERHIRVAVGRDYADVPPVAVKIPCAPIIALISSREQLPELEGQRTHCRQDSTPSFRTGWRSLPQTTHEPEMSCFCCICCFSHTYDKSGVDWESGVASGVHILISVSLTGD